MGRTVIFKPPKQPPLGILRKAADTAETMLKTGIKDPLDHANFEKFFSQLVLES